MRKYDEDYKREAIKKTHDGQSVASVFMRVRGERKRAAVARFQVAGVKVTVEMMAEAA